LTITVIILVIGFVVYFLFFRKKKGHVVAPVVEPIKKSTGHSTTEIIQTDATLDEEMFTNANGERYKLINKTREVPRKTYLLGSLTGKYWGEMDRIKAEEYKQSQFYDFHIYEMEVETKTSASCFCCGALKQECTGLHTDEEGRFSLSSESNFPREKLPRLLPIVVKKEGKDYEVNIYEPQMANVYFVAKLHQTEGTEVFGTIEATITGYLLDFVTEHYTEQEFLPGITQQVKQHVNPQPVLQSDTVTSAPVPTGNVEIRNGYQRREYFGPGYMTKYWGDWIHTGTATSTTNYGCLSSAFGIIGIVIGIFFLIMLLPRIAIILPFFLFPLILRFVPSFFWVWIFRIAGLLLLLGLVVSIFKMSSYSSNHYIPRPFARNRPAESRTQYSPVTVTVDQRPVKDTLIIHYRNWRDYDDNEYQGGFWIRKSAYANASSFKANLNVSGNSVYTYNEIVYRLKENDKNNLGGVYQLFDSIKISKKLAEEKFAELIVSFVQDIPYTVVLSNACDGALYSDDFIKQYLASSDARCDGYEKFGINTPVEFMATLNGDCDTRTLLIYTLLSHYNYDVVMLSSEYYNHSLIGINLPYTGIAYPYESQRYVLWETTAPNIKPGILPGQISNLNYWRISLKSK